MASAAAAGFLGRGGSKDPAPMKGLVQFIADLRNARARDLEEKRINKELANVRQKFKDGSLNGYQRKKYVCKLLYIYILGWNVDFGHLEAVNLVSSNKYSEKQIGYLAVTLFFHEQHELLHLVVNSIRKDLTSHNDLFNCLALHAIANVAGREMGEALADDVHRLLISPSSTTFVKKKAALTLLRLFRKHSDIIQYEWAERIISLMDDPDLGVTLSVTSLVMALAQDRPDEYRGAYVKAAQRLRKIVIDKDVAADYLYYKVPCPWIQVKLLRLMRYFPPSDETYVRGLIRESLQQILQDAMLMPKNVQQNNAQNAVLFEAINLVIHLDDEYHLMVQISSRLGKFIQSRETNIRYLGIEAMTHFAARAETLDPIKKHQNIIIGSLRDRDISVRRKGLDLLYSMCDTSNAQPIVNELLRNLETADYAIREEMVLKIAILTEKHATDIQWYIDISMRLISMAGDHVSDEVWQRIIQIVTNNEDLQIYAVQNILRYVRTEDCHESLVRIGAYLMGEFGHLVADNPGCSPIEQFLALQHKMHQTATQTRAIILSCFIKFVNLFPEIKPQLLHVFEAYSHTLDSELQQRACEYLALASLPTDDLLRTVCDEMPPFPERASALLSRLHGRQTTTSDKKTYIIGGRQANADNQESQIAQRALPSNDLDGLVSDSPNLTSAAHLSPGWEAGYGRLLFTNQGVLYEDGQIQVGIRSEYRGSVGCLIIYFLNRSPSPMTAFTTTLGNANETTQLRIDTKSVPENTVQAGDQVQQTSMFEARSSFEHAPTLRVTYLAGAMQGVTLQLPVVLHKYVEKASLTSEEFFKRWRQIGGAPREAQRIFGPKAAWPETGWLRTQVEKFGWGVLAAVDPNPQNLVAASICHTSTGKLGCLLRLELNADIRQFRVTIRATDELLPPILAKSMEDSISGAHLHI